jgi:nicotinate-nucleotide adenylyltransferase
MKIGILGGTFNPIHLGHLHLALEVLSRLSLDQILLVPTGIPPHKLDEKLASPEDRFEMVRLAILGHPQLKASNIEIVRGNRSYTIDTVKALKESSPETRFYFIIGLDAFLELESWKEPELLLKLVHFVVVSRPGFQFIQLSSLPYFAQIPTHALSELDREQTRELEVEISPFSSLTLLVVKPYPISSSEIREKLRSGIDFGNNLLPEPVKSFIMKKRIFSQ